MIKIRHPKYLFAGDEIVCPALEFRNFKDRCRITFHWGDDYISVVGANMVKPNVFEFNPSSDVEQWYLKYAVSQNAAPSEKSPYITIETIKSNKWQIYLLRAVALILIFVPLLA